MSASNWAICPYCVKQARAEQKAEAERVGALYGTVPAEEFAEAFAAVKDVDPAQFDTFREDYEIYGAQTGTVTVSYSGGCDKCGLSLNFTVKRRLGMRGFDV